MFKGIIEDKGYESSSPKIKGCLSRIDEIAKAAKDKYCNQINDNYLWQLPIFDESGNLDPDIVYKTVFESVMKLVGIESETVTHYVMKEKDNEN